MDSGVMLEILIEKYTLKIQNTKNEKEYWITVLECLNEEGYLSSVDVATIKTLLAEEEYEIFGIEKDITVTAKEKLLRNILETFVKLEYIFQRIPYTKYELELHKEYLEKNWEYDKTRVREVFKDIRKYYVLAEMFNAKYRFLKEIVESNIEYRKYSGNSDFLGGHYCQSPIIDLIISNVHKVGLKKQRPETMEGKIEYGYDKDGRLIMYKKYRSYYKKDGKRIIYKEYYSDEDLDYSDFLIYFQEWVLDVTYQKDNDDNEMHIELISLRRFDKELICYYEYADRVIWDYHIDRFFGEIHRELYKYSENEILETAIEQNYYFPLIDDPKGDNSPGLFTREIMEFESDNECIVAYKRRVFVGGRMRGLPGYRKLSERQRKSTKKTKVRWRRPNYFMR